MKVEILGPGCPNCKKLEDLTRKAMKDISEEKIELEKVEDPGEIASRGVMSTPALVVDGEIKISGRIPSKQEIREILD
ncbi:MAG: thioredoxin family protein [Candidatus Hadarchaeia archaeon]